MPTTEFKPGDRVRVLSRPATTDLVGQTGEVMRVVRKLDGSGHYCVVRLDAKAPGESPVPPVILRPDELELAQEEDGS